MTIVIACHPDTNGYTKETCKGTGRNGKRKDIGTREVIVTAAGTVIKAEGAMVTMTVVDTNNGIKWMTDWI